MKTIAKKIFSKKVVVRLLICYVMSAIVSFLRPLITKNVIDDGMIEKNMKNIILFSLFFLITAITEECVILCQKKVIWDLQNKFISILWKKVLDQLLELDLSYFSQNNATEILNSMSTDINNISVIFDNSMMMLVTCFLQFGVGSIGILILDWKLALIVLSIVPVKMLLVFWFSRKKELYSKYWIKKMEQFAIHFDDTINGIREIKLWNLQENRVWELIKKQDKVLKADKKNSMLDGYNSLIDNMLECCITGIIYFICGYWICNNKFTIGEFMAFSSYSMYVIGPIVTLFNIKIILKQIKPSAKRLKEFFELVTEEISNSKIEIKQFREKITFENVSFSYGKRSLFRNANFEINKGEKIAIIGDNGSGKSTLIDLLLCFKKPTVGRICIDGKEVTEYNLGEYRDLFAVVSQPIFLFSESVVENIIMRKKFPLDVVMSICKKLKISKMVSKTDNGHERSVNKNGSNFSGGEKQKIALARALIKNSPVLVLDEATSNLDEEYNKFFEETLVDEFSDKTLIIITHNKAGLKRMDKIYRISNGTLNLV